MDFFAIGLRQKPYCRVSDKSTLSVGIGCYDSDMLYCQTMYPNLQKSYKTHSLSSQGWQCWISHVIRTVMLTEAQEYKISLNRRSSRHLVLRSPLPCSWPECSMCEISKKNTEVLNDTMSTLQLTSVLSLFASSLSKKSFSLLSKLPTNSDDMSKRCMSH